MPKRFSTTCFVSLCRATTSSLNISSKAHGGIKNCPPQLSAFLKCSVLKAAVSGLRAEVIHKDWQKTPCFTSMSASMIYKACAGAEYKVSASTFFGSSPFLNRWMTLSRCRKTGKSLSSLSWKRRQIKYTIKLDLPIPDEPSKDILWGFFFNMMSAISL